MPTTQVDGLPTFLEPVRTRIDDRPKIGAIPKLFHLGSEGALAREPFLDRVRIHRHQLGRARDARHFHAGRPALVEIGLMESEACTRRYANTLQRHDAEYERAGGIADSVDNHAFAGFANALVLGFVFL